MKIDTGGALPGSDLVDRRYTALDEAMQDGIEASERGDKATAYNIFKSITERYPDNMQAWVWLGWSSPTLDEAEWAFLRAYELDPDNEEVYLGLRWVATQREDAIRGGNMVNEHDMNEHEHEPVEPGMHGMRMHIHTATAASRAADAEDGAVSNGSDSNGLASSDVQAAHRDQHDLTPDEQMRQAIATAQAGDRKAAHALFRQISESHPDLPEVWVWLGGTSADLDYAEASFRRALELDPGNQEARLGMRWVELKRLAASSQATPAVAEAHESRAHTDGWPAPHSNVTTTDSVVEPAVAGAGSPSAFGRLLGRLNISLPVALLVAAVILAYAAITIWFLLDR
jgi:tetratricopeptide (TPR) repeat protein